MPQQENSKTINDIVELRKWFKSCPAISEKLAGNHSIGINFLSEKPKDFAVFSVPSNLVFRENVLGERIINDIQTQNYIFASQETYGKDTTNNAAVLAWYQSIMTWIIEQNNARNYPEMDEGPITSILPTLTAYPATVGSNTAKYQIQLAVRYRYRGKE